MANQVYTKARGAAIVAVMALNAAAWIAILFTLLSSAHRPTTGCMLLPTNTVSMFMSLSPQCPLEAGDRISYVEVDGKWRHTRERRTLLHAVPPESGNVRVRLNGPGPTQTIFIPTYMTGKAVMLGRIGLAFVLSTALVVLATRIIWLTTVTQHLSIGALGLAMAIAIPATTAGLHSPLLDIQWLVSTGLIAPALLHLSGYVHSPPRDSAYDNSGLVATAYGTAAFVAVLRADAAIRGQSYFEILDALTIGTLLTSFTILVARSCISLFSERVPAYRENARQVLQALCALVAPLAILTFLWPDAPNGGPSIYEAAMIMSAAGISVVGQRVWQRESGRSSEIASNFSLACVVAAVPALALIFGEIAFDLRPYGGSTGLSWLYVWAATFLLAATVRRVFADTPTRAYSDMMRLDGFLSTRLREAPSPKAAAQLLLDGLRAYLSPAHVAVLLRTAGGSYQSIGNRMENAPLLGKTADSLTLVEQTIDLWSNDLISDPDAAALRQYGFTIAARLGHGSDLLGVLLLGPFSSSAGSRPYHREFIDTQCSRTAIAMHNALLVERARLATLRASRAASTLYLAHDVQGPLVTLQRRLESLAASQGPVTLQTEDLSALHGIAQETLERFRAFFHRRKHRDRVPLEDVLLLAVEVVGASGVLVRPTQGLPSIGAASELTRLIENLLRNAVEATAYGPPPVIYARRRDAKTIIDIQDRGSGLASDDYSRLFLEGFSSKGEGRGLGLNSCVSIAQEQGWKVELSARHGGGMIARVILPEGSTGAPR